MTFRTMSGILTLSARKGMGNRYPSNSVIRVAKQLLVNWKTANGARSSDYQPVIGLLINSRSIFRRSICWPARGREEYSNLVFEVELRN